MVAPEERYVAFSGLGYNYYDFASLHDNITLPWSWVKGDLLLYY